MLRSLPNSTLLVSPIAFGCSRLGESRVDPGLIDAAIDMGINLFDTADSYGRGRSEAVLGNVLGPKRNACVIATKVGYSLSATDAIVARISRSVRGRGEKKQNFSVASLGRKVDASLRRLKTTFVDLLWLHNPPRQIIDSLHVHALLADLQAAGKIRYFGISCRTIEDAIYTLGDSRYKIVQCEFSLRNAGRHDVLIDTARRNEAAIVGRQPFASGSIFSRREEFRRLDLFRTKSLSEIAIQFALRSTAITSVVLGVSSKRHLEEDLAVLDAPPLSKADLRALAAQFIRQ